MRFLRWRATVRERRVGVCSCAPCVHYGTKYFILNNKYLLHRGTYETRKRVRLRYTFHYERERSAHSIYAPVGCAICHLSRAHGRFGLCCACRAMHTLYASLACARSSSMNPVLRATFGFELGCAQHTAITSSLRSLGGRIAAERLQPTARSVHRPL